MSEEPIRLPATPGPVRAKTLGRAPLAAHELVPARMVNEALFCERVVVLEWIHGEFADNVFTVEGRAVHRRADAPGGKLPPKAADAAERPAEDERPYEARSVWLSSERLGLTAKIDVVEGDASGRVVPIEYKRGEAPELPEGAYLPERAQVCAQVLLLRDAGYTCDEGAIYFAGSRRRVSVAITDELVQVTLGAVARVRALAETGELPAPLEGSPKCGGCSLSLLCLPDETRLLKTLGAEAADADLPEEERGAATAEVRRLYTLRDDAVPLYVRAQGGKIGLSGERLVAWTPDGKQEVRLSNTSQVSVFGNVQVTSQAMRALLEREIPLTFFSTGGYYWGRVVGTESKNVELRLAQYRVATDPEARLALARTFVTAKIKNARTMLRRNCVDEDLGVLSELEQLARKAAAAPSEEALLGLEGTAARVYFGSFARMFRDAPGVAAAFDLDGRNRRPPRDPVNALLSFAYALLVKEVTLALLAVGLDPMLGVYHKPRFGRPSLALDLMEELRPIVADSVVITAINTGVVTPSDFERAGDRVSLKSAARRGFIQAYERRMDQAVTHPVFGYRVSYRRVLEVQARLLSRVFLGELERFPSFRTR